MTAVSEKALEMAEALWEQARYHNGDPASIIAAALQKLMDERDAWLNAADRNAQQHLAAVERAEAAERQLAEVERLWCVDRDALAKAITAAQLEWKRTGEAERKLVKVIDTVTGQLRTWLDMHDSGLPAPCAAMRGLIAHLEAL
jgi:hypothetical protein